MSFRVGELAQILSSQISLATARVGLFRATVAEVDVATDLVRLRRDGSTVAEDEWRPLIAGSLPTVGDRVSCLPYYAASDYVPKIAVFGAKGGGPHTHSASEVGGLGAAAVAAVQDAPRARREMALYPNAGEITVSAVGMPAPVLSGTLTGVTWNQPERGPMLRHITGSASNDTAGVLPPAMNVVRAGWMPRLSGVVWPIHTSQSRYWFGLFGSDPALLVAPSIDHAGFVYEPDISANWRCSSGDGSNGSVVDSGSARSALSNWLELEIDMNAGRIRYWIDGVLVATKTTNVPRLTVDMGYALRATTLEAVAKQLYWGRLNLSHQP